MAPAISKMAVAFATTVALTCAGSAYCAETAEVSVAKNSVAESLDTKSSSAGYVVLAADSRETNLQKTSTSLVVAGIEGSPKRRTRR